MWFFPLAITSLSHLVFPKSLWLLLTEFMSVDTLLWTVSFSSFSSDNENNFSTMMNTNKPARTHQPSRIQSTCLSLKNKQMKCDYQIIIADIFLMKHTLRRNPYFR